MIKSVNPGSRLELVANLELVDAVPDAAHVEIWWVRDRDTGECLSLAGLLNSFREDPTDGVIGNVLITIEPCNPHSRGW